MMLIPLLNQYQDAPDGLYQQYHNSRTQDTAVGPFGVQHLVTPACTTGVVHATTLSPHTVATCAFNMVVLRSAAMAAQLSVFVPSGV